MSHSIDQIGPVASPDSLAFTAAIGAQAIAANPERSAWVEANAGSGKTKVLIDRVARLLLTRPDGRKGAPPDSILCVTYTKAAANEMLSRLFATLGDWSIASDETLRKNLSRLEGRRPSDYSAEDLRDARTLFARALETPGGLRIETIHAFCARILRRFPLEAGIAPGFKEIEDREADELWQAVLNFEIERAAAEHEEAVITLSRATGGRGIKAALETLRFQREPLLAFSRRLRDSAAPMSALIREAMGALEGSSEALIEETIGAAFPRAELVPLADVISGHPKATGKDHKLAEAIRFACSEAPALDRWAVWLRVFTTASGDWAKSNPYGACHKDDAVIPDLFQVKGAEGREITRIKAAHTALKSIEAAERSEALLTLGLPIVAAYQSEKRKRAALDFDDLIEQTRRLLTVSNAAQWVLYKLDGGLTHILLDEAQDTSPRQWDLINALVEEFQAGQGRERSAEPRTQFVVGDPKQSIYSFQGADQEQFERERRGFIQREEALHSAAQLPEMVMSFRSSPEVLTFVDKVRELAPLPDATTDAAPPFDANLSRHEPRRANQPGRVELWPLITRENGDAEPDDPWLPVDHVPENAPTRRLAEAIAKTVRQAIDQGETIWREDRATREWSRSPLEPQDILILVRQRGPLFNAIIENLKKLNLPVAGADRLKLLDVLGVQDCLNLLRFTLQPGDDLTLAEILRGPFCGLINDDHHLFPLAHDRGDASLWERLSASTDPVFAQARAFCQGLLDHAGSGVHAFLARTLYEAIDPEGTTGFDRLVQRLGEPVRDPVRALLAKALRHDMAAPASLQRFLEEIEADESDLKRDLGEPEREIRVMTVHGAKGLQAPFVILPDTTAATKTNDSPIFLSADGVPLHSGSKGSDNAVLAELRALRDAAAERESRRLLYVALTRAQDRLIICGAESGQNKKTGYAKSSWYRWCQMAMCDLTANAPPEDGERLDSVLAIGGDPICLPRKIASDRQGTAAPSWISQPAPTEAPLMAPLSPSRLDASPAITISPFGEKRRERLRRGRLIHDLLQRLPLLSIADRQAAAERFLAAEDTLSQEQVSEIISVSLKTLNDPQFADIFSPAGRSEVPVVGKLGENQIINGRVDRLLVSDTKVLIIDYKTDQPAPTQASDVSSAYLKQMAAYQAILSQIYPDKAVECALLYTDGPHLVGLPDVLLSESLKGLNIGV
ncbi:double-strand break repair helicase AddA [Hyphomonas sp. FCG-A18]|uniref:double-strand break repair helicase AddA n=1 Tax=Hyphomonas sp. FCG-A18 TaxID=3080019 RepID=UPI002B2DAF9D|nr:double-strand break repair helicase AddA [Hyphomonas sp. FCG-A18]